MTPTPFLLRMLHGCAFLVGTSAVLHGQTPPAAGAAVLRFAEAFDARELDLDGSSGPPSADHAIYGALRGPDGLLADCGQHRAALRTLLEHLVDEPDPSGLRAVVRLAAAGTGRPLLDRQTAEVRALARRTASRWPTAKHWEEIADLVAGTAPGEPAERAAATRLLGRCATDARLPALHGALATGSDAARLAAAEALGRRGGLASLPVLARALRIEPHPITARVLAEALDAGLLRAVRDHRDRLARPLAVRAARHALGRHGWRSDYALVELLEGHPLPEVVPALITLLERCQLDGDALERALNERAREILHRRTHQALRRLTGAIEPGDDPAAWRSFWEREHERLDLPDCPALSDARNATGGGFFGIPVAGREVVFVIDVSGSMREQVLVQDREGERQMTRLALARREMLRAVQSLDRSARYHLFTFADETLQWNRVPVPPNDESHRQLAACLDRIEADDSTNLHSALQTLFEQVEPPQDRPGGGGSGIDEVFVLSDGEPTTGPVTAPEVLLELVDRANELHRIRFHCVHLGGGPGSGLLRELARRNDGVFVQR